MGKILKKIKMNSRIVICSAVSFLLAFLFGFSILLFRLVGKPFTRGFYCDDESIDKPYKDSTVPILPLVIVSVILAVACFVYVEVVQEYSKKSVCPLKRFAYKRALFNVAYLVLLCLYGIGITIFVTDVGKYTIGRLRPHFFSVCKPKWNLLNCTSALGRKEFFTGDEFCSTTDIGLLKEARLSFPSGHSSYAAFMATFLIAYLQYHVECKTVWVIMPKVLVQVVLGTTGFFVGLTRISDFKHHPLDVAVGFLIGIVIAFVINYAVIQFCNLRDLERESRKMNISKPKELAV